LTTFATEYQPYQWQENRKRYSLSEEEKKFNEYILKIHHQMDFTFDKDEFVVYSTFHCIVLVNSTDAIERNNTIEISMYNTADLVDIQARVITKEGKVIRFDKKNIKEIKSEEAGKSARIFAMEGVEVGSEIEYFYTRKMYPSLFDDFFLQYSVPTKESSFRLSSPKHLKFDFRTYNNYAAVKDISTDSLNVYETATRDIPALKKEEFSNYDANRMRLEYKLAYNVAKSKARLYTWDEAAKTFYRILTNVSEADTKALDKFVKTLNDNPSADLTARIKNIEDKIKTTVRVVENERTDDLSKIEAIVKSKLASKQGMTKLFVNVFAKLKIDCQPVVTCSREQSRFDGTFDSWSYLDEYLLYIPAADLFISPATFELRTPIVEPVYTEQEAMFIEPLDIGGVKSALATIKKIPALDYSLNADNLDITVSFATDLESNTVRMKRTFSGINAAGLAPYYNVMTEKQRSDMMDELTKQTAPDATISKWKADIDNSGKATNFVMDLDFASKHFIERAGNRILFKAGLLIGPQTELYRDDKRMTIVENDYNRGYDRTIRIELPAGYTIKNADDLKFNVRYDEGKDDTPFLFESTYSLKGNVLEIVIKEYYKEIFAPMERYEDFRRVINAAADFNKVTLVLEKR
jgi:hypothetical protein